MGSGDDWVNPDTGLPVTKLGDVTGPFTDPVTGQTEDVWINPDTGLPGTGSQKQSKENLAKLDEIQSILSTYEPARQYSPELDTHLTDINTQLASVRAQLTSLGAGTNDGVQNMMGDMQKQHISDCASGGLPINEMFDKMLGGISALATGALYEPIKVLINKLYDLLKDLPALNLAAALVDIVAAIAWVVANVLTVVGAVLIQIGEAVVSAASVVGSMLDSLNAQSDLKDVAGKLLSAVNATLGCDDKLLDGLFNQHPAVQNMLPAEMKAGSNAVQFAKSVATPTDTVNDILNEAKMKGVADLGLDTQVDSVNSAIDGKIGDIANIANNPPSPPDISIPPVPALPGFA